MKNYDNDIESKIYKLLSKMSLNEKIKLKHGVWGFHGLFPLTYRFSYYRTRSIKRLNIPAFKFTDGPRGVNLGKSTCFPVPIARGSSWDIHLEEKIAKAIGKEALSKNVNAIGSTCINIIRHPGWGRAQESFGSDPFHMSQFARAHVSGIKKYLMPVVKHYACNSIERTRFQVNVKIDEKTLREIYLPHFKSAVEAGAAAIMTAYNKVNGIYCSEHEYLIKKILREEWGFDGFVISDWFLGCRSTVNSIKAGLDIEMPEGWYFRTWRIKKAIKNGLITEENIDDSVKNILRQFIRFGLINENNQKKNHNLNKHPKLHPILALKSACRSIVLLKNENKLLPIPINTKKICVIGKLSKSPNLGSLGSSEVSPPWKISIYDGLKRYCKRHHIEFDYSSGSKWNLKNAIQMAKNADYAIVVAGLSYKDEGEYFPFLYGGDRIKLELPQNQVKLIEKISEVNPNTIVILIGGSAICINSWINKVKCIIMGWYLGMCGGIAITKTLFGEINPSGKLSITFPKTTEQLFPLDISKKEVIYDYWHDYRYYDKYNIEPEFPFGFGLSYTEFFYKEIKINKKTLKEDEELKIFVKIKNIGNRKGEEVVQLYIGYNNLSINNNMPIKELKGFKKISLNAKEEKTIIFKIFSNDLAYYNSFTKKWEKEEGNYEILIGSSSRDIHLKENFLFIKH